MAMSEAAGPEVQEMRPIPLEVRGELGLGSALLATVQLVWTAPGDFFGRRSRERTLFPAMAVGVVVHTASAIAAFVAEQLSEMPEPLRAILATLPADQAWVRELLSFEAQLATLLLAPVGYLFGWLARAIVWWLGLSITRAVKAPFREMLRSLAYCDAVYAFDILSALPFVGTLVGVGVFLWRAWLEVVAMQRLHDVPLWRVVVGPLVLAVLLTTVTCCVAGAIVGSQVRLEPGLLDAAWDSGSSPSRGL